jgi:hypothetical protein
MASVAGQHGYSFGQQCPRAAAPRHPAHERIGQQRLQFRDVEGLACECGNDGPGGLKGRVRTVGQDNDYTVTEQYPLGCPRACRGTCQLPSRRCPAGLGLPAHTATAAGARRAVRRAAGPGQGRTLDRRQDGGQRCAGLRRGLASLLLLFASRDGSSQPVIHPAQPANLRSRLEDAIRRVEHEHRTDNADKEQADHEFTALS